MMREIFNLHFDRESYQDRHGELIGGGCSKTILARTKRINEE